jgi:hypothetical protein
VWTLPKNQIAVHPEQSSRTASVPKAPALQRSCARRNTGRRYPSSNRVCGFVWRVSFSLYRGSREHQDFIESAPANEKFQDLQRKQTTPRFYRVRLLPSIQACILASFRCSTFKHVCMHASVSCQAFKDICMHATINCIAFKHVCLLSCTPCTSSTYQINQLLKLIGKKSNYLSWVNSHTNYVP